MSKTGKAYLLALVIGLVFVGAVAFLNHLHQRSIDREAAIVVKADIASLIFMDKCKENGGKLLMDRVVNVYGSAKLTYNCSY